MNKDLYSRRQNRNQKKKKLVTDFFNFLGTACTLLFINFMTGGGYWWALWPVGFYALAIFISFINFMRDEITFGMDEGETESWNEMDSDSALDDQKENDVYQDALELEELPPQRKKETIKEKKWDDKDMV